LHTKDLLSIRGTVLASALLFAALSSSAQYPGQVSKTSQDAPVVRSVAVVEWTGDEGHPKTSRIVPVSVYDGEVLQDGGIYLPQPAPLALSGEVEYELKDNGKTVGLFDINGAGQEQGSWIGFGTWKPLPKPKTAALAKSAKVDLWGDDVQSDRPVLHRKAHSADSSDSGTGASSGSSGQASDPDRPTLHKKSSDSDSTSSSAPAADPDRPTLKKKSGKAPADVAYVESLPDVSDPDRPRLQRGKVAGVGSEVLPTLKGLPPDMHQLVAVSDARNRPEHVWSYSWANPDDEAKMKAVMEDIAHKELGLAPPPPPIAPKRTAAAAHRKIKPALPPPPPAPLLDDQFRVFELAYGSGATMVLSARTEVEGAQQKFVTLIAQPDLYGNVVVLMKSVTDAAHLDDNPRMRLVDAVDAMADNRGELLFELRGLTERQFALYRVLRGQAARLFITGPEGIAAQIADSPSTPQK
jgi:hypothetical protein